MAHNTIALFGGTESTGKHFLGHALDAGFHVRALVPTAEEVDHTAEKNPFLTLIEGDLCSKENIAFAIKGATYVVCMLPGSTRKSKDSTLDFFTTLTATIQQTAPSVKVVLYQANAYSCLPGKSMPMVSSLVKTVKTGINGSKATIEDNNNVIKFVQENENTLGFHVIVSRPGTLKNTNSGKENLKADHFTSTHFKVSSYDLAVWSLKAIQDKSLYGTFPYVQPEGRDLLRGMTKKTEPMANRVVQPETQGTQRATQPFTKTTDVAVEQLARGGRVC